MYTFPRHLERAFALRCQQPPVSCYHRSGHFTDCASPALVPAAMIYDLLEVRYMHSPTPIHIPDTHSALRAPQHPHTIQPPHSTDCTLTTHHVVQCLEQPTFLRHILLPPASALTTTVPAAGNKPSISGQRATCSAPNITLERTTGLSPSPSAHASRWQAFSPPLTGRPRQNYAYPTWFPLTPTSDHTPQQNRV